MRISAILVPLAVLFSTSVSATTWTVDPGGGGDFTTIQAAIDAAAPGDTLLVGAGIYEEDLLVTKSLTLLGSDVANCVIYPATSNPGWGNGSQVTTATQGCRVQASDVWIEGLTFDGDNPALGHGIDARCGIITDYSVGYFDRLTVRGCAVQNYWLRGIYPAARGTGHLIDRNRVENCRMDGDQSAGVMFYGAQGVIRENTMIDCGLGVSLHQSSGGAVEGNRAKGGKIGFHTNGSAAGTWFYDNYAEGCDQGFQSIADRVPVEYRRNVVDGCIWGFSLFGLGAQLHTYVGNLVDGHGTASAALWVTPHTSWGSTDVFAHLRENTFIGCRRGIVADEVGDSSYLTSIDLDGSAGGSNRICGMTEFFIQMADSDDPIDARGTYWGTQDPAELSAGMWDAADDPALGAVDFAGWLDPGPDLRAWRVNRGDGPTSTQVLIAMTGNPGDRCTLYAADALGTMPTPWGLFELDEASTVQVGSGNMPGTGIAVVGFRVPNPGAGQYWLHMQGAVGGSIQALTDRADALIFQLP